MRGGVIGYRWSGDIRIGPILRNRIIVANYMIILQYEILDFLSQWKRVSGYGLEGFW